MKSIFLLLMLTARVAFGQDSLVVDEIKDAMSKGYKPGYNVFIPKTNYKDVSQDWKKHLKSSSKGNFAELKNETIFGKAVIQEISTDSLMIYYKINQPSDKSEGTYMNIFIMANDETFISSVSPNINAAAKSYIRSFAVGEYKNSVATLLSFEQKKLDVLKDDLRKIERDNETCKKKIVSSTKNNERLQEQLSANKELLENKSAEVDQQTEAVKDGTASEQKMDDEKKLKQLQKERLKLLDDDTSIHKDMEKNNSLIEDMQKKSDLNASSNIPSKNDEIEKQKEVVTNLSHKLSAIK